MDEYVTSDTLHRGAKYFMDSGLASTHSEAMRLLHQFGLHIAAGPELTTSRNHQIALLTLVNAARRTFLGGVEVSGVTRGPLLAPLADADRLDLGIEALGGRLVSHNRMNWPTAVIGTCPSLTSNIPLWQVTWDGWRGGVISRANWNQRLPEARESSLAAALAAAICASEAFAFYAGDHPLAGRRNAGLSLWNPGANWLAFDNSEPEIEFLPSNLWIIGLGNLGQAYLWMLATLPYLRPEDVVLVLQDYDRVAKSNDSTSMLTQPAMIGRMKSRAIAEWLEARKFKTILNEHRFGNLTHRSHQEPPIALCGVDNPEARSHLETAGFGLVVEAGLGSGVQAFKNFSIHSFPSSMSAVELWSGIAEVPQNNASIASAYAPQQYPHLDACGLAQLASRTVGVPFVGLTTAALVIAELLRRLHSGTAFELVTGSLASPEDMEVFPIDSGPYEFGYTKAESNHRTVLSPV